MVVKRKAQARMPRTDKASSSASRCSVYVIELDTAVLNRRNFQEENPTFVAGMRCVYVGSTSLSPEQRRANHLRGVRASRLVKAFGGDLIPELYENLNPMTREAAEKMEVQLAERLRCAGYGVWQR